MDTTDPASWLVLALGLVALALHLIALWQISSAAAVSGLERIAWALGALLVPIVGACAWFAHGRARDRSSSVPVDAIGDVLRDSVGGVRR